MQRYLQLSEKIRAYLDKNRGFVFIVYASLAAFLTYSCMYAFRKPYTVATFADYSLWGIDLKIWLIASQVLGYTLSKFIGIKLVSEMTAGKRAKAIILLAVAAELALLFFGLVPTPYNIVFLFINGLPLGMIWGLVFSYLEGRKFTEMLGAGLSVTFIVASGFVKTVGKWLMVNMEVSEFWMPFATGLVFMIPLIVAVYFLDLLPSPSAEDIELRTERKPMNGAERLRFFNRFAYSIVALVAGYAVLCIFREIRDNYAVEIWASLGYKDSPEIFTVAELPIGAATLLIMGMFTFIKSNIKALFGILGLILISFILIGISTLMYKEGIISGTLWMIVSGFGLYAAYIPFNALLFERMIASFRYVANIGFLIYIADSFGYLSSIGIFASKNFFSPNISWLKFFMQSSYYVSVAGSLAVSAAIVFIYKKYRRESPKELQEEIKEEIYIEQEEEYREPVFAELTNETEPVIF